MSWHQADKNAIVRIVAASLVAVCLALALRHLFLDNDQVRKLCDSNANQWFCGLRAQLAFLLRHPAVGWGILGVSILVIWRPNLWRFLGAFALVGFGLVLYQASLASGAAALLLLRLGLADRQRQ